MVLRCLGPRSKIKSFNEVPNMKVVLMDKMGTDLTVVNAARVSFNKKSEVLSDKDVALIHYLARHKHWTPFAHPQIQFHVQAPVFVARQLAKHQVGLVWNEISRRYVDYAPDLWFPEEWRGRALNKKQGSSGQVWPDIDVNDLCEQLKNVYVSLLAQGVAPELARIILPMNTYTEWYWTGSLYAFSRVCLLRMASDAQKETAKIAEQISIYLKDAFPVSAAALLGS